MDGVVLPPDLEQFATEAVATGRYHSTAEVIAAGLTLLQRAEAARAAFVRSLVQAEAEPDQEGWHSLEDVMAEADTVIAEMRRAG
jgi:putative addiction module CopG family antidote